MPVFDFFEKEIPHLWMGHRFAGFIWQQILFGHVSDIGGFRIFREQVVIGLVFGRAVPFGNRSPPFFRIIKDRVDVEDDAAEGMFPVLDDLADAEFRGFYAHCLNFRSLGFLWSDRDAWIPSIS